MFPLLLTWSVCLITVMVRLSWSTPGNSAVLLWLFSFYFQLSWSYFFSLPHCQERDDIGSFCKHCSVPNGEALLLLYPAAVSLQIFFTALCSSGGCSVPLSTKGSLRQVQSYWISYPPDFPALWAGLKDAKSHSCCLGRESPGSTAELSTGDSCVPLLLSCLGWAPGGGKDSVVVCLLPLASLPPSGDFCPLVLSMGVWCWCT